MKRVILAIMMIAAAVQVTSAQPDNNKQNKCGKHNAAVEAGERKHDPKEGFKKALGLTDEQAEAFAPIYKEYRQALRGEKPQQKPERINPAEVTDEQTLEFLNEWLDKEIHIATVRKAYIEKFLTVLTPKQVAKLYKMESSFGPNNPHGRAPQQGQQGRQGKQGNGKGRPQSHGPQNGHGQHHGNGGPAPQKGQN